MNESGKTRVGAAEVAKALRDSIRHDELKVFERLPSERVLAENYGVSRGTVREALNRLTDEGLVEIRAGSGTYVTYSGNKDGTQVIANAGPLELIDTRFALEPHICRLVVLHGQENDFRKLDACLDRMEQHIEEPKRFSEADTEFHTTLAEATRNSLLIWIIGQINSVRGQDQWARMRRITLGPEIIRKYNQQHRLILEAIRERDPERAAMLMKDHLETARQSLMRSADA